MYPYRAEQGTLLSTFRKDAMRIIDHKCPGGHTDRPRKQGRLRQTSPIAGSSDVVEERRWEYSSSANSLGSGRPTLHELINREETRHPHSQLLDTGSTVLLFPIDNHQGFPSLQALPHETATIAFTTDPPLVRHIIDDRRTIPGQNDPRPTDQGHDPSPACVRKMSATPGEETQDRHNREDRRGDGNRADLQPSETINVLILDDLHARLATRWRAWEMPSGSTINVKRAQQPRCEFEASVRIPFERLSLVKRGDKFVLRHDLSCAPMIAQGHAADAARRPMCRRLILHWLPIQKTSRIAQHGSSESAYYPMTSAPAPV